MNRFNVMQGESLCSTPIQKTVNKIKCLINYFSYSKRTKEKIIWALNTFNNWKKTHNSLAAVNPGVSVVTGELDEMNSSELCQNLKQFVMEVTKQSGEVGSLK